MNMTCEKEPAAGIPPALRTLRTTLRAVGFLLCALWLVGAAACGHNRPAAAAPHIAALNPPSQRGSTRPITIHGSVVDGSTSQPLPLAHVSYDGKVVSSDVSGAFTLASVRPDQQLKVVVAGYRRYVGTWNPEQSQIKLTPFEARGLYMPITGINDPSITATIDRFTNGTEINAITVEIKTDDGQISSQMATPAAEEAHAVVDGVDLRAFVEKMHQRDIYVVGRFVVFRDPTLAKAHPEYALKRVDNGQTYEDEQGQKWIDAFRQEVWQYDVDIAEKAAQLGIDEIQFDYVRFPGAISELRYAEPMTQDNRVAAIGGFLKMAEQRLRPYGIALGADTFGMTTIADDDTGIGQEIDVLGRYIDYYCPMVYPSTWADGSLGVAYPPADPYTIVHDSVQRAVQRLANIPTVKVRPWLQAFDDYKARRLDYTPDRVNLQKEGASKAGGVGWTLWHPISHYDAGAIGPRGSGTAGSVSH